MTSRESSTRELPSVQRQAAAPLGVRRESGGDRLSTARAVTTQSLLSRVKLGMSGAAADSAGDQEKLGGLPQRARQKMSLDRRGAAGRTGPTRPGPDS